MAVPCSIVREARSLLEPKCLSELRGLAWKFRRCHLDVMHCEAAFACAGK